MTSLVRRYLKTAIAFLLLGLATGAWMVVRRELFDRPPTPHVVSAHTHLLLVGFVMMMILGVALWMFPRLPKGDPRHRPALAESAYWALASGTLARAAAELGRGAGSGSSWLRWVVVLASLAQAAGLALFFAGMWPRIRAVGSQAREAAGERF